MRNGPIISGLCVCVVIVFVAQYVIGKQEINVGFSVIPILPMVFGVLLGMIVSLKAIRNKFKVWGEIFNDKTEGFCSKMVGFCLLILGTQYAGMIIPKIDMLISIGVPMILQELGNLLPILIAIPLAVKFGFGRRSIGACSSISREPSVAVISSRFGVGSPEYIGVLATYLCGSVFGVLWFSILGSIAPLSGLHPMAMAAGCGVGSGSMLSACAGALTANLDMNMTQQVLSVSATSNLLSSVIGALSLTYLGIPLAELVYKMCKGSK